MLGCNIAANLSRVKALFLPVLLDFEFLLLDNTVRLVMVRAADEKRAEPFADPALCVGSIMLTRKLFACGHEPSLRKNSTACFDPKLEPRKERKGVIFINGLLLFCGE